MTTNQKGLIAENAVIREAILLGIHVARPLDDERFDLILDFRSRLLRVQCKWAMLVDNVVVVRCYMARRGPKVMIVRRYAAGKVDAFAAYCLQLGKC